MKTYQRNNFDDISRAMTQAKPGTFFMIRGYASDIHPEGTADYWCQLGTNYRSLMEKDAATLDEISSWDRDVAVRVSHHAYDHPAK
jgi:hypothetical protein